jgi:hypothetical protein
MITRPGPARLPPAQAPGGVILRVYNRRGTMLVDRPLRPGEAWQGTCDLAKDDAIATLESGAGPGDICLVAYDGDTGVRWTPEDWDRLREKMDTA